MSSSQTLHEETQRLKRAVEELSILNDLARAIGASLNLNEIMHTIIRRSLRAVNAEQGVITLVDRKANEPMKTLIRATASSSEHPQFHLHQALIGWMHLNMKPLLVIDPQNDERFRGVRWDEAIQSILCVPLLVKGDLRGVLTLYNKKEREEFTPEDQRLLAIIAGQSAQVIENARLYEEEKRFLKMQEEVRLAAKIQMDLLPTSTPQLKGYQVGARTLPAQTVGGDYFDFIPVDDNRIAICVGDVTGKGLPASLLMANLQATLRGQTLVSKDPKECLGRANKLLFQSTSPEKFATLFYGVLDFDQHKLAYANAGHDHPFVIREDGELQRLTTGGLMLGAFEAVSFEDDTIQLQPGDLLVAYSDGVTEAMNSLGKPYGDDRLKELLLENRHRGADEVVQCIIDSIKSHVGTQPQSDDVTALVIKRTK